MKYTDKNSKPPFGGGGWGGTVLSRNQQETDKPYLDIVQLPMWISLLFGICHPLRNYQASATERFLKHPANSGKTTRTARRKQFP